METKPSTKCQILKTVLMRLVSEIEQAEAAAADTKWLDEQHEILNKALSDTQWAMENLAYEMSIGRLDTDDEATQVYRKYTSA